MKKADSIEVAEHILPLIRAGTARDLPQEISVLADAARELHGESVLAVLFYGSCLRSKTVHEGLADLYLLVDDYRSAYDSHALAFFNKLLPPNVFYLEVPFAGQILRAKYAVLSLSDFRKGVTCWFHSYIWGRFCQNSSIAYARDESVVRQIRDILALAVVRFVTEALPQMPNPFTARELWSRGLALSYRSELRTEQPESVAARLFDVDPDYLHGLTSPVLEAFPVKATLNKSTGSTSYRLNISENDRRLNWLAWRTRILQGKILSILRLLKGFFTFKGGIEYIQWKIERHSGVRVEVGQGLKRLPLLAVIVIFWRLYRQGAFR